MLLLNKENIKEIFTMDDAIESMGETFTLYSDGKGEVPLRTVIHSNENNGDMLFMPAFAEELECASLKIVSVYPSNKNINLPVTLAQVLLLDAMTGQILAILDGTYITQLRTGATSGMAFKALGKEECKIGALIGAGTQAMCQLEAMICAKKLETVKVFDCDKSLLEKFIKEANEELKNYNTKIEAANTADEAIKDADLLITVTPSSEPVFDGALCKKGITISCVGAYQPHMQELDPNILLKTDKIYFDSQEAVLAESGDILKPLKEGIITHENFTGEIGNVLLEKIPGRENEDEIIVFETVGIGLQDLVIARKIYERAKKIGIGLNWQ